MLPRLRPARLQQRDQYRDGPAFSEPGRDSQSCGSQARSPGFLTRPLAYGKIVGPMEKECMGEKLDAGASPSCISHRTQGDCQISTERPSRRGRGRVALDSGLETLVLSCPALQTLGRASRRRSFPVPLFLPVNAITGNASDDRSQGPIAVTAMLLPQRRPSDQGTSGPHHPST
ncbi:hypothetical protein EVG20_g9699 [Dentipellis fragilis]|uniref:Uncharacterized protein n=1 Tax=Dentipellis fragilis TaxID=205917 RepID=A0A4Y9XYD4_9AGAM|nr:hypothetical protein EVG20_g9699 [Dentipellis fragilis]